MAGYARLSNGFWQDKDILKLRRMNPSAALLYVMAISWCSDHASDGIIADDELLYVLNASDGDVADLVASGLLLRGSDEGCYMIRNYLKYQNSSRQIDESAGAGACTRSADRKGGEAGHRESSRRRPEGRCECPRRVPRGHRECPGHVF